MADLLNVEHLSVSFFTPAGEVQAVRDVSFSLKAGEVLAIVGESGCGKSVLCKSILRLLPQTAKIKSGKIIVDGTDITAYREREMTALRGSLFSMVFQDPMTALDVTIQAQILDLLRDVQQKLGTAAVFVTHDLGVVARVADRVAVMYAGKIVETGTAEEIFYDPRHPYTWGLLRSLPALSRGKETLPSIPGIPPTLIDPPQGDAFASRNEYALAIDYEEAPPMFRVSDTHYAATWLLDERAPRITPPVGGAR